MKEKQFGKAIFAMILENPKESADILKQAKEFLVKSGDFKLLKNIERVLRKLVLAYEKEHTVTVVSSEKISKGDAEDIVHKHKKIFPEVLKVETRQDQTIIGGEIIEDSRMKIDNSHKTALMNIYQKTIQSFI